MHNCETISDLLASIAMTNNGYLFAPTPAEMQVAIKNQDIVDIRCGQIHKRGVACEHPRKPDHMRQDHFLDAPDYEGAILARQEADQRYW